MTTKLDTPIRREITINGELHTVVISGAGIILTKKRARAGIEVSWAKLQHTLELEGAGER